MKRKGDSSDFFSAYLKYKKETETFFQFCWAHLIREIKFLTTLDDTRAYGKRLLKYVQEMFAAIHRQDTLTEIGFKRLMNQHKKSIMKTVRRFVPSHKKAAVLSMFFVSVSRESLSICQCPFHEKACRYVNAHHIVKVGLLCAIRHVALPFQIGGESGHIFAEESGFFDGFGQADVVRASAVFAPIH